ncbi:MAG: DUF368 domain-containing protein [Oscillospiraceae bacterium]|nr:DUF368 domain-containing protein [Oscillospiraceae bacterium]
MILLNAFRGFCMALADSVPGVSGGTIAFLLGFYDKFIGSLNNLISGTKDERKEALKFILKLGIGWVIGFLAAILVLSEIFESHIYVVSALFFGLTLFAIPIVIFEEHDSIKGHLKCIPFLIVGVAIVVGTSMLSKALGGGGIVFEGFNIGIMLFTFVAGMLAISAMVLPGISGATILLAFGVYLPTVNAISSTLKFESFEALPYLCALALGIITGIILVIKAVDRALKSYRPQSMYVIIGLMIGSLYAICQGPTTLDTADGSVLEPLSFSKVAEEPILIVPFIAGGVLLAVLQFLRYIMEKKEKQNAAK